VAVQRYLASHNLPDQYILFVGTFEPRKNLGGLLRAYAELRAEMRDAPPLVIAGRRGWLFQDMFVLAEQLHLGKSIIWLDNPSDGDLPALYGAASVFCLPSRYEGFGLPVLEAMACGTPVVVSERGSLPEVVGEAGLLVNPDDPNSIAAGLTKVLSDSVLSADLRRRGLTWAQAFTWRKTAELTLAVYHRVLGG
jgi:glycosyltransferase involved in cell wall biosynthesis